MTEPTMTTRTAFAAVGEFVRRGASLDLAELVDLTRVGGGRELSNPSVWQDWAASVATVADGAIWEQEFRRRESRPFPYDEAEGQRLTLSEAFLAMSEFLWAFAHRDAPADLADANKVLSPREDGEPDAIAWRNWIHIVAWVLHGRSLHGNSWTDAFRAALHVSLPEGVTLPPSFALVDPDIGQGTSRDACAQWVNLPFGHDVQEIDHTLVPLLPDLKTLIDTRGAVVDLVVWLDPVGELAGVAIEAASMGSILALIRDIWVEAEPYRGRDRTLTDEIRVRSSNHERSFLSNDAGERQLLLTEAVHAVAEATAAEAIEIELIPRAGKAGLVVTRPMLNDIAAAGHGLRLVSEG